MSTKVPIYLKRGGRKGKKEKLRDLLSSDMISPPLGDFRHTIHIGSGGGSDMFGDISFLQGKFHLLPGTAVEEAEEDGSFELPFQFTRTATLCGRELPDGPSPLLKNAISLPVIGGPQALTLPTAQAPPKPPRLHLETPQPSPQPSLQEAGSVDIWRIPEAGSAHSGLTESGAEEPLLSHASSLLSLHVDLGPSILDDVLQIMDQDLGHLQIPT
ncbi:Cdc42 effector protein 2 [Camelus dromedarius]|uniref:Cdc42 effector protein 2 n=2 Tax=Camelus TaxID=9836 RepID=T0MH51_CAMFR|nr:cdc42 effector protein 2 [Camelus ferus]XP_010994313.1 cdc42 effector protein 2 [Camelus dromedarius]EQB77735.1 cdc42 effector protein 2 isoform 1 [Camelus ferus]KAB1251379.1 Cdc42 effector protein 2 [Camelus dromedarius]